MQKIKYYEKLVDVQPDDAKIGRNNEWILKITPKFMLLKIKKFEIINSWYIVDMGEDEDTANISISSVEYYQYPS